MVHKHFAPEKALRFLALTGDVPLEVVDLTYFEKDTASITPGYYFGVTERSLVMLGIKEGVVEAEVRRLLQTNEMLPATLAVDFSNGTEETVKYLTLKKLLDLVMAMGNDSNFKPLEVMMAAGITSFVNHIMDAATTYYANTSAELNDLMQGRGKQTY